MSEQKHTQGIMVIGTEDRRTGGRDLVIGDFYIATTYGGLSAEPANAQRIVLCWNTHDQLVRALRAVASETTPGVRPTSSESWLPPEVVEQVLAALAAAGVKS